ncbi:MAG TPA: phage tail sheath C-terminal domain-containing protein [Pyrinomonadaceae bacterium]|jgi:hypothetical protein
MAEQILPGVQIEVRAEALIVGGPISVGNIGIVGTAARGTRNKVEVIGSYGEAREIFGPYDAFDAPETTGAPLTLVRALEIAYNNGASTVFAVRVAGTAPANAAPSTSDLAGNDPLINIHAKNSGSRGNDIRLTIAEKDADPLTDDTIVTITNGTVTETYTVKSNVELAAQTAERSNLVTVTSKGASAKLVPITNVAFAGGQSGADATPSDYEDGLAELTNQNAHIIVAAGLSDDIIADELMAHVNAASTDKVKRDRIAVVGSRAATAPPSAATFPAAARTPAVSSDRVVYVAPGIKVNDSAAKKEVTLPGAYAAAAIAGMLSARSPHISLTNKAVAVGGLEAEFSAAQLEGLVQAGVLAIEKRRGIRVVKGITTDPGAFQQITTRRIVDFAKFGVRAAAEPFIGLLNNDRVRQALKGSINGFLADMVTDEMIISYELDVTATRDDEIRGVARVTMTVRPTFSIDFIKVVMFLG